MFNTQFLISTCKNLCKATACLLFCTLLFGGCSSRKGNLSAAHFSLLDSVLRPVLHFEDSSRYFYLLDSTFGSSAWGLYFKYSNARSFFFSFKKDYLKAELYGDSMLTAVRNEQDDPAYYNLYARALMQKGEALLAIHQPDEAFALYYQARENILKIGDTCSSNEYSGTLASALYTQKKYKEAAYFFRQSAEEAELCPGLLWDAKFVYHQANLDNIGLCYSKAGISDSAIFYFDSTLRYLDKYGGLHSKGNDTNYVNSARGLVYGNKAKVLIDMGKEAQAEQLLKESIRINSQRGYSYAPGDVSNGLAKLAALYLKQSRLPETGEALRELKAQLDTIPNIEMLERWNELSVGYFEKTNNLPAAMASLKRFHEIKDSVAAVDKSLLATDIEKEFKYQKSEYALANLQKLNKQQSLYLLIAGMGGGMGIIILALLWKNYRQSRTHIAELEELNGIVQIRNQYLQKTLASLEKSQQEHFRMLKVIAHDLRDPVGGMVTLARLMLWDKNCTPGQKQKLDMMQTAGSQSLRLIEDILHFNASLEDIEKRPVDMQALLLYNVSIAKLKAAEKKQEIVLKSLPVIVLGDNEKLTRVFSNLLSNAIKFSPEHTAITVTMRKQNGAAVISVIDKGIGMPPSLKEKIFSTSADIKRKGTAGEPSFGFGLAICKEIVQAHSGSIWLETEPGKGTTFYVSLPEMVQPMQAEIGQTEIAGLN